MLPGFLSETDPATLRTQMTEGYGMPVSEIDGGTVSAAGVYRFPGDPDLYPMALLARDEEQVYIYAYGIVAFVSPDCPTWVTRMD